MRPADRAGSPDRDGDAADRAADEATRRLRLIDFLSSLVSGMGASVAAATLVSSVLGTAVVLTVGAAIAILLVARDRAQARRDEHPAWRVADSVWTEVLASRGRSDLGHV